jgi:hypothetical protein
MHATFQSQQARRGSHSEQGGSQRGDHQNGRVQKAARGFLSRPNFVVRAGTESDVPFICKSWLETLRSSHEARAVDSASFSRHHLAIISRILKRPGVQVRIAAPPDDDFTVYAFVVMEPGKIHLAYTRKAWRRMGIAKELLQDQKLSEMSFSTWSPDVQHWAFEKYRMQYVPNWIDSGREHGRAA